jgi:hypothetical protein
MIVRDGSCRHCWYNTNGDCGTHGPLVIQTGFPHPPLEDTPFGFPFHEEGSRMIHDEPAWDCTDFAHPAWWRGHQHTTAVLCQMINEILDNLEKAREIVEGVGVSTEPWQSTRLRIAKMMCHIEELKEKQ